MALTFHLIPHTHWDREWYLTRAAFQARLVPVMDSMLEQLEQDEAARFVLDGQTVLLEDYLAVKPENEARIAALVGRGALEIGPWYVLSDLLIPSAASLRRNLEEGTQDAKRFGKRLDVLYSPDAFGHPAGLPRLAAEFGIRRAVVRRGLGRPFRGDRDLYRWEDAGGASLLVYHLPAGGYDAAIRLSADGVVLPERWAELRQELVDRAVSDQIAVFLGADHHAMVRDLAGLRARLQALEPEHGVRVSGLREFFEAVERSDSDLQVIQGELRRSDGHSWVLQGVQGTRMRLKRKHASEELFLTRVVEPLATLAARQGGTDRTGLLRLAWRGLLQSQFHDTLAGTTSDAVQLEQELRLGTLEALSREIADRSLHELAGYDPDRAREHPDSAPPRLVLWNPSERPRSGIATAELSFFRKDVLVGPPSARKPRVGGGYHPFALEAPGGALIPVQLLALTRGQERRDAMRHYPDQDEVDRVWIAFQPPELPALGVSTLSPRSQRTVAPVQSLEVAEGFLANPFVAVHVSSSGSFALSDRRTGAQYGNLCELCDEADRGDLYTVSRATGRAAHGGRSISQTVMARGPWLGAVETHSAIRSADGGEILLRQLVVLHADSPLVHVRLDLENHKKGHRVRARFPIRAGATALAGAAFGTERRGPVAAVAEPGMVELEAPTAPAQRFIASASGSRGLALFAPGHLEYEWTKEAELFLTLFRSVGELSRGDLKERPGHAGWPMATPLAQEPGLHVISLAVAPIREADLADGRRLEQLWEDAFLPLQAVFLR